MKSLRSALEGKTLTSLGSIATAGANFLLALVLIPRLTKAEYGTYGFCMIAVQLFYNISNALAATPLASDLASAMVGESRLRSYSAASIALAITGGSFMLIASASLGAGTEASIYLGIFAFLASIRWYGRTYCLSLQRRKSSAFSDFAYATSILIAATFLYTSTPNLASTALCLTLAAAAGLLALPSSGFFSTLSIDISDFRKYVEILKSKAAWALLAVLMAELTINSHAYVVTAFRGAEAYAVLAVVALFFRPTSTMLAAIGQSERPKVARLINQRDRFKLEKLLRDIRIILLATSTVNLIIALVAYWITTLAHQEKYDSTDLLIGAATWAGIMALRSTRLADTIYCQASGKIKEVASISVYAGITSFSVVLMLVFTLDNPIFSITGILGGDAVLYVLTRRLAKSVKRSQFKDWIAAGQ